MRKDRPGMSLARAASGRKTARSDYEQAQIMLQLQAVERMKEMVHVSRLTPILLAPFTGDFLKSYSPAGGLLGA